MCSAAAVPASKPHSHNTTVTIDTVATVSNASVSDESGLSSAEVDASGVTVGSIDTNTTTITSSTTTASTSAEVTSTPSPKREPKDVLKGVALFSISGGVRDIQVAPDATSLNSLVLHSRVASLNMQDMASCCSCSAGHLAVLWCRQFVDELAKVIVNIGAHCGNLGFTTDDIAKIIHHKAWALLVCVCV